MHPQTGALSETNFSKTIEQFDKQQIFILVDENTKQWFEYLLSTSTHLSKAEIIEIESGEQNKSLDIVAGIWKFLSDNNVRRNALFINLGGGVITDMGGFIAATYKRGISFINIPTTLLAMIDAAIGGKTGIDLDHFKNQVGVFQPAEEVYCDVTFLETLPKQQLISGFAEALKHGLIYDHSYWSLCIANDIDDINWNEVVQGSIRIKSTIVANDPKEKGERKLLNFGHTIGHAVETHLLNENTPILHGYAVALGMICEAHISYQQGFLKEGTLHVISDAILAIFGKQIISENSYPTLLELMKNDKKNTSNAINFTFIESIGKGIYNQTASEEEIIRSLNFYNNY